MSAAPGPPTKERSIVARFEPAHNRSLFETLVAQMGAVEPETRVGAMFGCPAAFVGRRMVFCVYGEGVGVRLPHVDAARLIAFRQATAFRPFGRPPMKEWVELRVEPGDVLRIAPILALALRYAREQA